MHTPKSIPPPGLHEVLAECSQLSQPSAKGKEAFPVEFFLRVFFPDFLLMKAEEYLSAGNKPNAIFCINEALNLGLHKYRNPLQFRKFYISQEDHRVKQFFFLFF